MSSAFIGAPDILTGSRLAGYARARERLSSRSAGDAASREVPASNSTSKESDLGSTALEHRFDADAGWLLTPALLVSSGELGLLPHLLEESYMGEVLQILRQRHSGVALRLRRSAPDARLCRALKQRLFSDFVLVSPARMRIEGWPAWQRLARGELHDAVFKVGCAAMAGMAEGEDGDLLRRAQEKSGLEQAMVRRLAATPQALGKTPARLEAARLSVALVCATDHAGDSFLRSVGLAMLAGALAEADEVRQRSVVQRCAPRHLEVMRESMPEWLSRHAEIRAAARALFEEA